jgi:hypothetical protein
VSNWLRDLNEILYDEQGVQFCDLDEDTQELLLDRRDLGMTPGEAIDDLEDEYDDYDYDYGPV